MLKTGLILMIMGMGMVFMFLTILYFVVLLMGKVMGFLDKIMPAEQVTAATATSNSGSNSAEIAVAIAAAKSRLG
ncbi:OadG family protein [bacterium]|nr:OadG family protein [bacterium]